jgi:diguanylate cyclase (GGDEF)-like protein/PAS domain S-box-containing protein
MQSYPVKKSQRLSHNISTGRSRRVFVIGLWVLYVLIVFLFIRNHSIFPVTIVILILVLVTGSLSGIKDGLIACLLGSLITALSYLFLGVGENINPIRLGLTFVGYFLAGGIAGGFHDLNNRLKDELKDKEQEIMLRKELEQALRESEKHYRELFELESDAIFIIQNQDGAILEVNSAACILYGFNREEMLSLKNTDLSAEPEKTRAKTQSTAPIDQVVKISPRWHRKKDGTVFPVEITARFIQWKGLSVHIAAIRDITERREVEQELERLAITDPLTGLLNRRQFFIEAEELFARAQHHPYELSTLMIDIDHFKKVNDQHGHATGDAALREVARRLNENVRPTDVVGRYGGEEFTIILPRTNMEETRQIAGRLCAAIANKPVTIDDTDVSVTISMGVAGLDENVPSLDELLQRADQALYTAKEEGRNRWAEW